MTTKSLFFTRLSQLTGIASLVSVLILGGGAIFALSVEVSARETNTIAELLPPPPPIGIDGKIPKSKVGSAPMNNLKPATNSNNNFSPEYTFSAPKDDSNTKISVDSTQTYRVEVFGDTEGLLDIVKSIEPKAFQKGNIVQAGIFSSQDNAAILVNKLAVRGLWSRIVVNN